MTIEWCAANVGIFPIELAASRVYSAAGLDRIGGNNVSPNVPGDFIDQKISAAPFMVQMVAQQQVVVAKLFDLLRREVGPPHGFVRMVDGAIVIAGAINFQKHVGIICVHCEVSEHRFAQNAPLL
jgi:hypothetical protein